MNSLDHAWAQYLGDGDEVALLSAIESAGHIEPSGDYPYVHRLQDVNLSGAWYRVCRSVQGGEQIFITPCQTPCADEGVPFWLKGAALSSWVDSEFENPSKEPIDWEQYR